MIVKCIRRCWDGKKARRYYPGDQDDIDPKSLIAKYFEFPKEEVNAATEDSEITALKEQLKEKGISFHPKTGKEKLQALLDEATKEKL